jgi:hypothetical protein
MQCNIDARGKAVRLGMGISMCAIGATAVIANRLEIVQPAWVMYAGIGLLVAGAFGVVEGWAGWCVMRAMGFKTRI